MTPKAMWKMGRRRGGKCPTKGGCFKWGEKKGFNCEAEQLHDYVLFAVNTGLRPDEAWRLEFRDVTIVDDEGFGQDDPGD